MSAPDLPPRAVSSLVDWAMHDTLARRMGDAAAHRYVVERARTCRRCCVAVADPDDPMAYCVECAERDARP